MTDEEAEAELAKITLTNEMLIQLAAKHQPPPEWYSMPDENLFGEPAMMENALHEMLVADKVVQDVGVPIDREKLTIACWIGVQQEKGRFARLAAGLMLEWLNDATEEDIKWLFDKNAGNR